jgi:two-component system response regulator PilR (NtrC family)
MKNRLLVVEDETAVATAFTEYLSNLGFHVDCTDSAQEAMELADEHSYAVLLSDLRLSRGGVQEGLEFIKAMRKRHPETAVAVLSGAISVDEAASVHKMGARVVLRKPKPLSEIGQILMGLAEPQPPAAFRPALPSGDEIARLTAKGSSDTQIADTYHLTNEEVQEIRSCWFNSMPPRQRIAVSRELSRKVEVTH